MKLKIKAEDAQKIMDYLVTKPFNEVHQLVGMLVKLEPEEVKQEEAKAGFGAVEKAK